MQRKTSGEAGRELVCTAALCFAESNDLVISYSNLNFNEHYGTITLFQAALSPPRLMDTGHGFPEMQKDDGWMCRQHMKLIFAENQGKKVELDLRKKF